MPRTQRPKVRAKRTKPIQVIDGSRAPTRSGRPLLRTTLAILHERTKGRADIDWGQGKNKTLYWCNYPDEDDCRARVDRLRDAFTKAGAMTSLIFNKAHGWQLTVWDTDSMMSRCAYPNRERLVAPTTTGRYTASQPNPSTLPTMRPNENETRLGFGMGDATMRVFRLIQTVARIRALPSGMPEVQMPRIEKAIALAADARDHLTRLLTSVEAFELHLQNVKSGDATL